MAWPRKAPSGFLTVNNKKEVELYALRMSGVCLRCNKVESATSVSSVMEHFLCIYCRRDVSDFDYQYRVDDRGDGIPHSVQAMANATPDVYNTQYESEGGRY